MTLLSFVLAVIKTQSLQPRLVQTGWYQSLRDLQTSVTGIEQKLHPAFCFCLRLFEYFKFRMILERYNLSLPQTTVILVNIMYTTYFVQIVYYNITADIRGFLILLLRKTSINNTISMFLILINNSPDNFLRHLKKCLLILYFRLIQSQIFQILCILRFYYLIFENS